MTTICSPIATSVDRLRSTLGPGRDVSGADTARGLVVVRMGSDLLLADEMQSPRARRSLERIQRAGRDMVGFRSPAAMPILS